MGFLFLVLYPPPSPPPPPRPPVLLTRPPVLLPHTLTLTLTLTHSLPHSLPPSHSLTHSLAHSLTHSPTHSLTLPPSLPHPPSHSLTPSLSLPHPPSHSLTHSHHGRRGTMCTVKGFFCVAGVGQCQGVGCTPRGSAGVPGSLPLCVAGVGQCALPRGRMYAPGFRWRPWLSASFAWQAWDTVHCQGVGCTPRGSAGVPGSPPLLCGRRGTMCIAKGSDVRPGVPLASLGLFCVAGVGQCALSRGRMYAPGFRWRPWVSASFAWQAWDNVHCQGVGCTPRGSAGVPGSPPLLRGRRGTMCTAKGSDVRPGVPLASLGIRLFCVAGVGQCALPRGRMYAPGFRWRPWLSASFAWQAWDNVHCQGVGCTPRGSAGVPGSPPLLRGRRGTMCAAKGLDVRPGVPLASLGLRLFCVAGVGQCARWMYAPGFRWRPWVSASFAWQAWSSSLTSPHSLTLSLSHSLTLSHSHSLSLSLTHSHISHSHTPHSHHSLTVSLTHLCTWLIIIIIVIIIIINNTINIIIMMLVLEYDNSTSK